LFAAHIRWMSQFLPEPPTADEFAALKMVGLDSRLFISRRSFERLSRVRQVRFGPSICD
jgi:hypothetical protein